ncbi:histidine ABC transporter permease HisQ [Utexia brackfieldae]|uniref:ABC transporter permease n=1 Tax=Utexia brackfieldae TaxID=3074108 RepID=UPI00370D9B1F
MFQEYLPALLQGMLITLQLAICAVVLAISIGLLGALGKLSKNRLIASVFKLYTSVIRGIPDLVLMLLVFYGVQIWANMLTKALGFAHVDIDPMIAGIITLGFIYGAYFTETFRGAYLAVSKGQIEAAKAFGFSGRQTFVYILFPQMMRFALPGIANNWLVILKATALVSILGLQDLIKVTKLAGVVTHQPLYFALVAGGFYLFFTTVSHLILWWIERHYSIGMKKTIL